MFGYIRYIPCGHTENENDDYKGYYCGLCKSMRFTYGPVAGAFLSYDTTFLAILLDGISSGPVEKSMESCILHPFRKRPVIRSEAVQYASAVTLLLSYHKMADNRRDGSFLWSLPLLAISPLRKRALKKIAPRGSSADKAFSTLITLEESPSFPPEGRASAFGTILGEITSSYHGPDNPDHTSLFQAGFHLGRWIYYIDALDDYEKDLKTKNYNPLPFLFPDAGREKIKNDMTIALQSELFALSRSLGQVSLSRNETLVEAIVYQGLNKMTTRILEKFYPSEVHDDKPLCCVGRLSPCEHGRDPESLPGTGQEIPSGQTR
jgi:hypothetical protein